MMDLNPRQEEALDCSVDVSVNAGAGSGKTKVLVQRFLKALEEDPLLFPSSILALTFTEKAASEMRSRVRKGIRELADREGGRWEPMIEDLERSDISTIHSFCMRLLRDDPVPLGLDPDMGVVTEMGASELLTEVLSDMMLRDGPCSGPLRRLTVDLGQNGVVQVVRSLLHDRGRMVVDLTSESFRDMCQKMLTDLHNEAYEKAVEGLDEVLPHICELAALGHGRSGSDQLVPVCDALYPVLTAIKKAGKGPDRGSVEGTMEGLFSAREALLTQKGEPRSFTTRGSSQVWGKGLVQARRSLTEVSIYVHENITALRFSGKEMLLERARERLNDLLDVLSAVLEELSGRKREMNVVDFDDQIGLALRMLEEDSNGILDRLRARYRHIMVDEFQDTDPRQWRIVSLLWDGGRGGKLFIVGDPKQSIYGFRSADVRLFNRAREAISSVPGGRGVVLDRNYRSKRELMAFVNHLFGKVFPMGGPSDWGSSYDPLEPHRGPGGTVKIAGVFGAKDAESREGAFAVEAIKRAVGREMVEDEDGGTRPMRYSDIAILFPYRTRSKAYEDALRASSIPYQINKGKGFFDRQEVKDVLELATFLSNPNDPVALSSVLKGPFFSLSDTDLLRISMCRGQTLLDRLRSSERADAAACLEECIEIVRCHPHVLALDMVLRRVGAYALAGGRRGHLNLDKLLDWAAAQTTVEGFSGLVRTLSAAVKDPPMEGEPSFNPESDAVSVLTVHAAKGLEWPMVMVLGLHHDPLKDLGSYHLDPDRGLGIKVMDDREGRLVATSAYEHARGVKEEKDIEERKRVLYVACTRAKDHLVLSGVASDGKMTSKGPSGSMAVVMEGLGIGADAFREGILRVEGAEIKLVALTSEVVHPLDEGPADAVPSTDERTRKDPFRSLGPVAPDPALRLLNPTSKEVLDEIMAELGPAVQPDAATPWKRSTLSAPSPRTMGEMVHAVMMGSTVERTAVEHGYPGSAGEVARRVKVLREKVAELAPVREWRELEVCTSVEVGRLGRVRLMGRMDLVLELGDGSYIIVDFKTGRERPEYRAQLEVYRRMLANIVGPRVVSRVLSSEE